MYLLNLANSSKTRSVHYFTDISVDIGVNDIHREISWVQHDEKRHALKRKLFDQTQNKISNQLSTLHFRPFYYHFTSQLNEFMPNPVII